jgi:hypothetical protein
LFTAGLGVDHIQSRLASEIFEVLHDGSESMSRQRQTSKSGNGEVSSPKDGWWMFGGVRSAVKPTRPAKYKKTSSKES